MDVVTLSLDQALGEDRVEETGRGAVIEERGRFDRLQAQVDADAVALAGADPGARRVERVSLLVVGPDQLLEIVPTERAEAGADGGEHVLDRRPAFGIQSQASSLRLVAEDECQEFADLLQRRTRSIFAASHSSIALKADLPRGGSSPRPVAK